MLRCACNIRTTPQSATTSVPRSGVVVIRHKLISWIADYAKCPVFDAAANDRANDHLMSRLRAVLSARDGVRVQLSAHAHSPRCMSILYPPHQTPPNAY